MKKLLVILLLSPLLGAESRIYLSCSLDSNAMLMKQYYGQRVWISIHFDKNYFAVTSHKNIREKGNVLSEARELVISPDYYKAKGRIYKLNRTNLTYGEGGSEIAYCKKQTKEDFSKQVNAYLKNFKNKRQI